MTKTQQAVVALFIFAAYVLILNIYENAKWLDERITNIEMAK